MNKKIIALVGRPNVGKSTLFNRLSVRKRAIVHDKPGVTRDRKYADASIGSFEFTVIDTPGLEESEQGKLEYSMMEQTIQAITEADVVCLIVDGKEGVTPADIFFANMVRKYHKNHILIINKCEKKFDFDYQYYKLGFKNLVAISAEHAIGMMDLYEAFITIVGKAEEEDEQITDPIKGDYLQIVVSGKPNSGKSTFINSLLKEERLLTGEKAGITRESIEIDYEYNGNKFKLIDTAGLRKKNLVKEQLEKLSTSDTINSIKFANTVILMIDAQHSLQQQDLTIASYVVEQGRSLVIAVNKWDLINNKTEFKEEFYHKLEINLPQIKGVPVIFLSALIKQNIYQVLDACIETYKLWNKKIPTHKLNDWLGFATSNHQPPMHKGRRIRIKYMTQTKIRPPTFKLFSNIPDKITEAYKKYLINNLRDSFDLPGVPIRFSFDKTNNPYVK